MDFHYIEPATKLHQQRDKPSCFIHKIDKSIAQICMAVKVTGQIQKVEVAREPLLLQQLQKHMPGRKKPNPRSSRQEIIVWDFEEFEEIIFTSTYILNVNTLEKLV